MNYKAEKEYIEISKQVELNNNNTYYTWIKYADDQQGNGMSDNPMGKLYLGVAYNKLSPTESTNPKDYKWSKVVGPAGPQGEQGVKGEDGVQGPAGSNGKTTYFHIKYSEKPIPTLPSDMTETPSTYIGTYVDFTIEDSNDPLRYTWSRFEGIQGPQGEHGIKGENGEDGKSSYLHIKYSNDGGKTFTTKNGETPGDYMGQYVDYNLIDSSNPKDYRWNKIKGEDGRAFTVKGTLESAEKLPSIGKEGEAWIIKGDLWAWVVHNGIGGWTNVGRIKGEDGKDGYSLYTWIKYADDDKGKGMSDNPQGKSYIGMAYNKTSTRESDDYREYVWKKIVASDFNIVDTLKSESELPKVGAVGEGYIVKGELFMWHVDPTSGLGSWANMGQFIGRSTTTIRPGSSGALQLRLDQLKSYIGGKYNYNNAHTDDVLKLNVGDTAIVQVRVSDRNNKIAQVYIKVEKAYNSTIYGVWESYLFAEDGGQGPAGVPGPQGPSGETSYFHVKYSEVSNPTITSQMTEIPSTYIGTYVDFKPEDSNNPKDYTWARFKGAQGDRGQQGIQGNNGADGKTSYLHIKYSDDGGKTFTQNNGEDQGIFIGQYVDYNSKDSEDPKQYKWSVLRGVVAHNLASTSYPPSNCLDYCTRTKPVSWSDSDIIGGLNAKKEWFEGVTIMLVINCTDGNVYNSYQKVINSNTLMPTGTYWINKKGATGAVGPKGSNGQTTYFHIKYSRVPNPTSSQMLETPSTYIGTYVDFTEADSNDPNKYKWSRFEGIQGAKGDKGIPGNNGIDGKTSYLHIKYSNDGGRTFTGNGGEDEGNFIGQYVDYNQEDSKDPTRYKWALIKGVVTQNLAVQTYNASQCKDYSTRNTEVGVAWGDEDIVGGANTKKDWIKGVTILLVINCDDGNVYNSYQKVVDKTHLKPTGTYWITKKGDKGDRGATGAVGPKGENGKTTYFHIKYSRVSNPTLASQMTETPSTYIGTYVDFIEKDSDNPRDYVWSRFEGIQGAKGEQGIPGYNGKDGKTSYLHIKYSNDGGITFTGNNGEDQGNFIGQYVDYVSEDSKDPRRYKWALIKGLVTQNLAVQTYTPSQCKEYCTRNGKVGWGDNEIVGGAEAKKDWVAGVTIMLVINCTDGNVYNSYQKVADKATLIPTGVYWITKKGDQGPQGPQGTPGMAVHIYDTVYSYPHNTIVEYSTVGHNDNWAILSPLVSGTKIGDTIGINIHDSTFNSRVLIYGRITSIVNSQRVWMTTVSSLSDGPHLDWIEDWDGTKVTIGGKKVLSPRIFAGSMYGGKPTGVALGSNVFGSTGGYSNVSGLAAYQNGKPTFTINTNGSVVFGDPSGKTGKIEYTNGILQLDAQSIKLKGTQVNTFGGGRNLLRNSNASNGTTHWVNNGGGLWLDLIGTSGLGRRGFTTNPNKGGIRYYQEIPLKPNTEYVYQAMVWTPDGSPANNSSAYTPMHFWCKKYNREVPFGGNQDGAYILDYDQYIENGWKKLYVHFKTVNWGDVRFTPFIYGGWNYDVNIQVTQLMLSEGSIPPPYSPHPDEIYNANVSVDDDGLTVKNGKLKIQNNAGTNVLYGDTSGNLTLAGNFKLPGTIYSTASNGETIEIGGGDYVVKNNGVKNGYFGFSEEGEFSQYRTPRMILSHGNIYGTEDYFGIVPYKGGNGNNPQNYPKSYVDMYYKCNEIGDWSNLKFYGDGNIRLSPLKNLEITTNFLGGKFQGGKERSLAQFTSVGDSLFDGQLQVDCVENHKSSAGLILSDSHKLPVARVRIQTDSNGKKFFRPCYTDDTIELGSGSYRWWKVFTKHGLDTSSDIRLKENINYIKDKETLKSWGMDCVFEQRDLYDFVKDDLNLTTYNFINDKELKVGFLAQDIEGTKVGKTIINKDLEGEENYLSYDTNNFTNVLAGALKEAINKIEEQETKIEEQEIKINDLQKQIEELKQLILNR